MAFGWMAGPPHTSNTSTTTITNNLDPRQRRQAVKAVFYRAVEDVPWAKVISFRIFFLLFSETIIYG